MWWILVMPWTRIEGVDADGDGWSSERAGGLDCNDRDPGVHPLAVDRPRDGIDADCDGDDPESRLDALLPGDRLRARL